MRGVTVASSIMHTLEEREWVRVVGYRDVPYFGSTFKKLTGMSPSEYQDRCR